MDYKKCFIVCPISNEGSNTRKRADDLLKYIIEPACEQSRYQAERVDQIYHIDKIDNKIIENLRNSELVIADVTEQNANAFFELGYRIATGKPVIQLAEEGTILPFDVITTNTIFYSITDLSKADAAKQKLAATIKQISEQAENLARVADEQKEDMHGVFSSAEILSSLYQIQNSIADMQETLKANSNDTIASVVKAMQSSQPPMSPETAMQAQLINAFMQNPDGMMKIVEMSDKLTKK